MIRREFLKVASAALGTATLAPWVLEREAAAAAQVDAAKSALADVALATAKRLDDKIQFLLALNAAALDTAGVSFVNSSMRWINEQRFLATSDGSRIEQYLIRGEPQFTVTAVNRESNDFQTRRSLGG